MYASVTWEGNTSICPVDALLAESTLIQPQFPRWRCKGLALSSPGKFHQHHDLARFCCRSSGGVLRFGLDPASMSLFFLSNNICQGNKACYTLAIDESTKALRKVLDLGKLKTSKGLQTPGATLIPPQ